MANKLTKLVVFAAVAGAAAAGVYYYMQKKEAASKADDDFDVIDGDLEAESKKRFYVNLNLDNVESALTKAKEKISDSYNPVKDSVKAGLEGSTGGSREFVDLTDEDGAESSIPQDAAGILKDAEEKLTDAANEGVTKVENFFDEEE
jgi:hypothetical protein